jgi:hypothetical protein
MDHPHFQRSEKSKLAIRLIVGQNVRKHHLFRSYDQQWGMVQEYVTPTWLLISTNLKESNDNQRDS